MWFDVYCAWESVCLQCHIYFGSHCMFMHALAYLAICPLEASPRWSRMARRVCRCLGNKLICSSGDRLAEGNWQSIMAAAVVSLSGLKFVSVTYSKIHMLQFVFRNVLLTAFSPQAKKACHTPLIWGVIENRVAFVSVQFEELEPVKQYK